MNAKQLATIDNEIVYLTECMPEYAPIKGNAMASGDDVFDAEARSLLLAEIERVQISA